MKNLKIAKTIAIKIINSKLKKHWLALAIPGGLAGLLFAAALFYNLLFWGKIFPGIEIMGIDVGGKRPDEAVNLLEEKIKPLDKIVLVSENQRFEIPLDTIGFSYDHSKSTQAAYYLYRTGNTFYDFYNRFAVLRNKVNMGLRFKLDQEPLEENLSVIAGQVALEPVHPSVKFSGGKVVVEKGSPGTNVDLKKLKLIIGQCLAFVNPDPITIPKKTIDPTLSDDEIRNLKGRAERLIGKNLGLNFEGQLFTYKENEIFKLLEPVGGFKKQEISNLVEIISKKINREPQNAVFEFKSGKVQEFLPAKNGVQVKTGSFADKITQALIDLEGSDKTSISIDIPVAQTPPKITTEEVNNLGIEKIIGRGTSRFRGSIASRVYNISIASSKFNGVLVSPNETFSFNNVLGDVSSYTGYKQAYIIKDGKTVLGDGGGVCQVSTTLFRALLDAGLPIIERRAHAYRVAYYEQDSSPGLDATVYEPTTDLKFKNDTPGHLLIQTSVDTRNARLVFEIYGASDGREATTTKPIVTNVIPPPEDLYQDDPTLPEGTIKQIDWKAWGAKVRFDYQVERNGEIIYKKTFYSNYRPWQAVYLRGTGQI